MSLNKALADVVLAVSGKATLRANWIAAQIEKIYIDAWRACFSGEEANQNAFRGITTRVNQLIYVNNDLCYKTIWLFTWKEAIEAMPQGLVFAVSTNKIKKTKEAKSEDIDGILESLIADLKSKVKETVIAALKKLAALGGKAKQALNAINQLINHPSVEVRAEAMSTVTRIGRSAVPDPKPSPIKPGKGAAKAKGKIINSLPEKPPVKFETAKELYTPPTQSEIDRLNLGSEWRKYMERTSNEKKVIDRIQKGIIEGKHNREIAKDIRPLVEADKVKATRIARTETHRINTAAQEDSLRSALGNSIGAWRYTATLDERTRPAHAARDGKVYDDKESRPLLPDGPNCRCVYTPVTKSFTSLGIPELEGLFTPQQRASVDGAVPGGENRYSSWFNRQSASRQERIVGKKRFESLPKINGKVKWSEFVAMKDSPAKEKPEATIKGTRRKSQ